MATLTIRNVPTSVVKSLKSLARRSRRSMEQEVRELLESYVAERRSVLQQIEAGWATQPRRPTAEQVDDWIGVERKCFDAKTLTAFPKIARRPGALVSK